jgi:integrase
MEKFPRANPVADVPKRKVVKRLPDYLRPTEVLPLLASLTPKWKNLFATAIYTGMRKGELFALQKVDVDFEAGLILVGRSHDRDIPKGGRVDAIPINTELLVYLKRAIAASTSELVFPAEDGGMLPKHTKIEAVLRRAMRRAGLVTGYVHKCRRQGCGHHEATRDANPRRCSKCSFKLFPVGDVRKIRFHHPRHTTASLLLMSGADLAAVQRIMRHQDPRLTTEVYGHLSTNYLKKEIERLSFGPPAADETKRVHSAGGESEPPLPADTRAKARSAAPSPTAFTTRLLPDPPPEPSEPLGPRTAATEFRELTLVGARGFEPPTFRSRTERATRLRHAPWLTLWKAGYAKLISASQRLTPRSLTRRRKTSIRNSASVASRIGVRSGCRVSRRSPPGSSASRTSVTSRPPVRAATDASSVGPSSGGCGRSSGANGSVMRPLAAAIGVPLAASRPVNSNAPDSMSGRRLAS